MIRYDFCESPIGILKLGYIETDVVGLAVVGEINERISSTSFSQEIFSQLNEYFAGQRMKFEFSYRFITGTVFQKSVWNALGKIPYGEVRSYQQIAQMIGNPKACRAVGGACNKNPIMILLPCHRVIGANGALVGFGGGLEMKEFLLKLENNRECVVK